MKEAFEDLVNHVSAAVADRPAESENKDTVKLKKSKGKDGGGCPC